MKKYTTEKRALILRKRVLIPGLVFLGIFATRAALVASGDTTAASIDAAKKAEKTESVQTTAYRLQLDAYIRGKNRNVGPAERKRIVETVLKNAPRVTRHRNMRIGGKPVDPVYYVTAFIKVESTFYRRARSGSGAMGYMQLMPRTFTWMTAKYGKRLAPARLYNTETNIYWGVSYINMLIRMMPNPRLVVLAYNAGPNNVRRGKYRPSYWRSVSRSYAELSRGRARYLAQAQKMHDADQPLAEQLAAAGM